MHTLDPPIRSALILLGAALLGSGCGRSGPPAPHGVPVNAIRITPHPVSVPLEYPAQLEASNTVEIRPRVGGVLERQEAVEGQRVKLGQILFVIDRQPYAAALAQAQAALSQAQAAKAQAERDLERARPLSQLDALSQRELDAAIAAGAATTAQVQAGQAAVRTAELNLDYTIVRAPIDGVMSRALIRLGGLVTAYSTLLTTVYKTDPMYVNFSISEQRLLQLQHELGRPPDQRNRSKTKFHVYLSDGSELEQGAELDFVDAAVDLRTDTLPVRLTVQNPAQLLRSGQFVKVTVENPVQADAIVVPQRAVQELQDKRFVWTVDKDHKAASRDVVLGARIGQDTLVAKGLAAGDMVVVDGTQKLKEGTPVDTEPTPAGEKRGP
jgi:membrane fusion protein, multidrug efflux system